MGLEYEVVDALGLSVVFVGMMLTLIIPTIMFFSYHSGSIACRASKKLKETLMKMGLLIVSWGVFMFFNLQSSASENYEQIFSWYSINHLFALVIGSVVFLTFLMTLPKLWKEYDKRLLVIAGAFALLSILTRFIFPIFQNVYLGLTNRVIVVIPVFLGFFMIVKFLIKHIKTE